jgi:hypothetical protein
MSRRAAGETPEIGDEGKNKGKGRRTGGPLNQAAGVSATAPLAAPAMTAEA